MAEHNGRKDKNRVHATHHGILSRNALEALVRSGENVRELRRVKRLLRAELQPEGMMGEIIFDRAWSAYLRCILISRTEANILAPKDPALGPAERTPILRESRLPTLVYEDAEMLRSFSGELLRCLALVQRYDAHVVREFYRAVGMLLTMRGAAPGITQQLAKAAGGNKDFLEDING